MQVKIKAIQISTICSVIPKGIFNLRSLIKEFGEADVEAIIKSTGIKNVRISEKDKTAADYCYEAANILIDKTNIKKEDIDGLIFVSQTPDYIIPQNSIILQDKIGLTKNTICFDLRIGCSGYIHGIYMASLLVNSGSCRKVMVLAGDTTSKLIHPNDRSLRMVFGDAFTATMVEKGKFDIWFQFNSDGSKYGDLIIPAGGARIPISNETKTEFSDKDGNTRTQENLFMDGFEIFRFAIIEVPKLINSLATFSGIARDNIKTYILHQANEFMVNHIAKKMKISNKNMPVSVEGYGNTGPASIPLLLCEVGNEKKIEQQLFSTMLVGFGIGLSWAGLVTDLSQTEFIKPIEK